MQCLTFLGSPLSLLRLAGSLTASLILTLISFICSLIKLTYSVAHLSGWPGCVWLASVAIHYLCVPLCGLFQCGLVSQWLLCQWLLWYQMCVAVLTVWPRSGWWLSFSRLTVGSHTEKFCCDCGHFLSISDCLGPLWLLPQCHVSHSGDLTLLFVWLASVNVYSMAVCVSAVGPWPHLLFLLCVTLCIPLTILNEKYRGVAEIINIKSSEISQ